MNKMSSYSKYGLGLTIFASFGWIIITLSLISSWTGIRIQESSGDLLNWAALTVEVALAVIITGAIFYVSKKQQDQIQTMLESQQVFLKQQNEFQERRRIYSVNVIRSYLLSLRSIIEEYDTTKMDLGKESIPDPKDLLNYYRNIVKHELKNMTFQLTFASDVLDPYHVETIRRLLEITDQYIEQKPMHNAQHHGIFGNIDLLLKDLPDYPA